MVKNFSMKQIVVAAIFLCLTTAVSAQKLQTGYVAARSGIAFREVPNASAKMLEKIPYGEKIMFDSYTPADTAMVTADGITGNWRSIQYKGKKGFITDIFLLPIPPPKKGVNSLEAYFQQLAPAGAKPVVVNKVTKDYEIETSLKKSLHKNGLELQELNGYENYGSVLMIPDMYQLKHGFLICRLLAEMRYCIGPQDDFPLANRKQTLTLDSFPVNKTYKVFKWSYNDSAIVSKLSDMEINRIEVEAEAGAFHNLEIFIMNGQMVISYGSGV
jgi:hypothetical protein